MSVEPVADFEAPDGIEPVIGWRVWFLDEDALSIGRVRPDVRLRSLNGEVWQPGKAMEARCRQTGLGRLGHGVSPKASCDCGVYAAKDFDSVLPLCVYLRSPPFLFAPIPVLGLVSLWGRVIVHESGYRAQFAYPSRFWVDDATSDESRSALANYRVPVLTTRDPELHRLIEVLDLSEPMAREAALDLLLGRLFARAPCEACQCSTLQVNGSCFICDMQAEQQCKEDGKQTWLAFLNDLNDLPPRLNRESEKAKTFVLLMLAPIMVALVNALSHPIRSP